MCGSDFLNLFSIDDLLAILREFDVLLGSEGQGEDTKKLSTNGAPRAQLTCQCTWYGLVSTPHQ